MRSASAARLYLEGRSHKEIAEELGAGLSHVYELIEAARVAWLRDAAIDMANAKAKELAKLDAIEAEAWAAWYRSIGPKAERISSDKNGAAVKRWNDAGDKGYLATVLECVKQRCKILGLNAAEKHEHTGGVKHFIASLYGSHTISGDGPGGRSSANAEPPALLPGPPDD